MYTSFFLVSICIQGLIELRGGAPLLDMLPDVFEWPITVDNWEINYGGVLFSAQSHTVHGIHRRCLIFVLCCSGKTWRLEDTISRLNEKYGTQLVVNFFVGTDDRDSNSHIIHVGVRPQLEHPYIRAHIMRAAQYL